MDNGKSSDPFVQMFAIFFSLFVYYYCIVHVFTDTNFFVVG